MEFEVPTDLIREVQSLLRREAGLFSYDPDDPSLPSLPSLAESIAQFDPSAPYLRCKHCKGRLLRGLQSVLCVYCGREQRNEVPPDPIAFKSTVGYRWLLQSLDLDGSETVGPSIEANESNRGHTALKDELSLSDLLDLEIKWVTESEKPVTIVSNQAPLQSKSSLNLAGVDLDNFFAESKRDTVFNAFEEQLEPNTQTKNTESPAFQVHEKPSLFENDQPSYTAARSSRDENGDVDSGWDADFQSASSGNTHEDSKSFDPFMGSTIDISAQMDTVFGLGKDKKDGNPKDDLAPPASMTDDWFHNDLWNNSNSWVSNQAGQFKETKFKYGGPVDNLNNPSSSVDWIQANQWQTSSIKASDNKTGTEDDESFDGWNDFTSSTGTQDPSHVSWKQRGDDFIHSDEQATSINLFTSTNNLGEMDFGSFSQPNFFTGAFSNQNSSTEVNEMQTEVSVSDSKTDAKVEVRGNAEHDGEGADVFNATMQSKTDDAEILMSQMHDLSFMLKSNLSIPTEPDGFS